ncbi:MAG: Lrp/AsnC family transcriptional regulator [Aquificota bacterium]|nr:MAG: Lrp/AsnC family transcriptional regulator [Aquificota bacterium]
MIQSRDGLIKAIQEEIPIVERPFGEIGKSLDIGEDDVIKAIEKLKEDKVIRQISPIYDTRMLGYDSSLVAFKVKPERIEEVASFINTHPGVSHNYERTHEFNLWFTIAVPPDVGVGLEDTVRYMAEKADAWDYKILRTKRVFKIGVKLSYESLMEREEVSLKSYDYRPLTEEEKLIVRITQEDMPLVSRPFREYAKRLNMKEEDLIEKLLEFKSRGILRRISAILYHRRVGFTANAMTVWKVKEDMIEEVGRFLASFKSVSHCYERSGWDYNLFAMIHGKEKEEVKNLVKGIGQEIGLKDYALLFSTREFKKRRISYFSEDFYRWYEEMA